MSFSHASFIGIKPGNLFLRQKLPKKRSMNFSHASFIGIKLGNLFLAYRIHFFLNGRRLGIFFFADVNGFQISQCFQ